MKATQSCWSRSGTPSAFHWKRLDTRATVAAHCRGFMSTLRYLVVALSLMAAPTWAVQPGEPMPDTRGPVLLGDGQIDLADYRGRWLWVDFWASWCAPCQLSLPVYEQIRDELIQQGLGKRIEFIGINVDARERDAERSLRRNPLSFPLIADPKGEHPARWQLPTMPTAYLVNPEGEVVTIHQGFRAGDEQHTRALLNGALGQPTP